MYTVYKHTTPCGKSYIGITSQKVIYRWKNGNGYVGNKYFFNAIKKYGWENISHEILFCDLEKDEACNLEIKLIEKYQSNNPKFGYNLSSGGEKSGAGTKWSEKTRKKHLETRLNNKRKHTEEEKEKIRKSVIQYYDVVGRKTKRRKDGFIRDKKRNKKIICIENEMIFNGAEEAAKWANIKNKHLIYSAINGYGNHKTAGGYHWRYLLEGDKINEDRCNTNNKRPLDNA